MKQSLILFVLLLTFTTALGQRIILSGKISDEKGQGIPFASIYVKNTSKGTSANAEGEYRLNVSGGKLELVAKAMGYRQQSQVLELNENRVLDFSLSAEAFQLGDVVVRADGEDPAYAIIRQAIKKR